MCLLISFKYILTSSCHTYRNENKLVAIREYHDVAAKIREQEAAAEAARQKQVPPFPLASPVVPSGSESAGLGGAGAAAGALIQLAGSAGTRYVHFWYVC